MTRRRSPKNNVVGARRNSRGFTLFELGVTVSIIGILIVVLLSRLAFYRDEAERLVYEQTVTSLRAAVQMKAYALILANRKKEITVLAGQNPFNWLERKPANYLGEYYSPDIKKIAPGHWFFDRSDGLLVYLLNQGNTFDGEGSELLQFKVSLLQVPGHAGNNIASSDTLDMIPVQVRKKIDVK